MSTKTVVTAMMAGCAVVLMWSVPGLAAQTPHEQHVATDAAKATSSMAAKDKAMMAEREKMMADMKAADERLDKLVARMNTASGADKMAATATVVTEMVMQRRTMQEGMMKMEQGMMTHMMEHMQAGTASMAMCPLMKQTGDVKH
jgi:DNA repair exonuclease SbcCD ATPase subunit